MRIKVLCLVALMTTAVPGMSVYAQQTDSIPYVWTLESCIEYARLHNIQLLQKQIAVAESDTQIEANEGALLPSLSAATNQNVSWRPWSQSFANISNGTLTTTSSDVNYNGTYGLNAQWTVWNGGRNRKTLARSRVARSQAEIDVTVTFDDLKEQIAQIYVQILYQAEAVKVNEKIYESSVVLRDRAKEMYDVGSLARADLAQMEAQVSQDDYNVVNARTQLDNFKLQLKSLLQITGTEPFEVSVPAINDDAIIMMLPSVQDVYETALAIRPEIGYSKLGIDLADMDIDIAKRGYYPSVSLSGAINTSNSSGMDNSFASQLKHNLSNSVGLTVSVPIFDNRQNKTNVARARLQRESMELELDARKTQLYSDIEGFWLSAANAQKQYAAAKVSSAAMQESYNLVSEQFEVGLKDIVDVITAKNNLLQADQQLLQSKYTAVLNRAMLNFYAGHPLVIN